MVARIPIGSGPGEREPREPADDRPQSASTIRYQSTSASAPQPLEQARAGGAVLVVVEHARVVELLEQAEEVRGVLGRLLSAAGGAGGAAVAGGVATGRTARPAMRSCPDRCRHGAAAARYASTPKPRSGNRYASRPMIGRRWTKRR